MALPPENNLRMVCRRHSESIRNPGGKLLGKLAACDQDAIQIQRASSRAPFAGSFHDPAVLLPRPEVMLRWGGHTHSSIMTHGHCKRVHFDFRVSDQH
jgi:hypothetical protein